MAYRKQQQFLYKEILIRLQNKHLLYPSITSENKELKIIYENIIYEKILISKKTFTLST